MRRVYLSPVACKYKDCWGKGRHGNTHIVYRNGRDVKIDDQGSASDDAQISPNRRTVGWTRGEHKLCTDWSVGGTMFVNSKLVLYRNGRILHTLEVPGTFIENWHYWNNGKYVAIGSRWHHGMGYCRLFDVTTGKLLERISTPEATRKGLKWAKDLTD